MSRPIFAITERSKQVAELIAGWRAVLKNQEQAQEVELLLAKFGDLNPATREHMAP